MRHRRTRAEIFRSRRQTADGNLVVAEDVVEKGVRRDRMLQCADEDEMIKRQ